MDLMGECSCGYHGYLVRYKMIFVCDDCYDKLVEENEDYDEYSDSYDESDEIQTLDDVMEDN